MHASLWPQFSLHFFLHWKVTACVEVLVTTERVHIKHALTFLRGNSMLSIYFWIPHDPLIHNQLLFEKSEHFHFLCSITSNRFNSLPERPCSEATVEQRPRSLTIFGFPMTHWVTISCCCENLSILNQLLLWKSKHFELSTWTFYSPKTNNIY